MQAMHQSAGMDAEQDVLYPIYHFSARWLARDTRPQDREKYPDSVRYREAPEGMVWDSTSGNKMFRTEPTEAEVEAALAEWWTMAESSMRERAEKEGLEWTTPALFTVESKFVRRESWCGGWFSHWTFDTGQSDADLLASFTRFVHRMEDLNGRESTYEDGFRREAYCLMGAEDRWRWTARAEGTSIFGGGEETGEPPCRCEHCRAQGIVRIDH